jgi:trehalose synthase
VSSSNDVAEFENPQVGQLPAVDGILIVERVRVAGRPIAQLQSVIGDARMRALANAAGELKDRLSGRTVWQVNSTASGGGVAELLRSLLSYLPDLGADSPWLVIKGDPRFFEITKRLHNRIHGHPAGGELDEQDAAHYEAVCQANAQEIDSHIRPGDVLVLHDPQTAGMIRHLAARDVTIVWRCHIGSPEPSAVAEAAWDFLRPHIMGANALVFTRPQYRPDFIPHGKTWVIRPSIDPFAAKNVELDRAAVEAILVEAGVFGGDGSAQIVAEERPTPQTRAVVQISRWDRLKDMRGVMLAFADHVPDGYLILAGPQTAGVSDDPEGAEVYAECAATWTRLPAPVRRRVMLASLPMEDFERNARIVNALQRYATVVTQKSLAEGFGLTVAEALWKSRPVVGSAVGGIVDQIAPGSGVLVDPHDPLAFGQAVRGLLENPDMATEMGQTAHRQVYENFLPDVHLMHWIELLASLVR